MNWIRIDVGMKNDAAIDQIAEACSIRTAEAVGLVVNLLGELPQQAKDGDLSGKRDKLIEQWARWEGEPSAFAQAFRSAMCTDEGVVRTWEKHNGSAIREAEASRARVKEWKEKQKAEKERERNGVGYGVPYAVGNTVGNGKGTPLRNGTIRNETELTTKQQQIPDVADAPPVLALALVPEPSAPERPAKPRKESAYPNFPRALCDQLHTLWISTFGAVEYPRFRKALGPLFTVADADRPADSPTDAELAAALKAYADLAPVGTGARFANVTHAAGCLAAIARTRREYAHDPDARVTALMRIIHGRTAA